MLAADILKSKSGKQGSVATVDPEITTAQAIAEFIEKRIAVLPVVDKDGKAIGILTERDILHGIAERGAPALEAAVKDVLVNKAHTCSSKNDLEHIARIMAEKYTRHVLVVDDDNIKGIISLGDVLKCRFDLARSKIKALQENAAG